MDPTQNVTDVARAIQLALAPVFLLTGIAGMLNVMSGRLSRIIDRGRTLAGDRGEAELSQEDHHELSSLEKRRAFVSIAITACTIAALLLCMVIVTLFVEVMFTAPLQWLIGTLFTVSTLAVVVGLAFFLREVQMAARFVRIATPGKK